MAKVDITKVCDGRKISPITGFKIQIFIDATICLLGIVVSYVFYQYVDYPGQGFFCDDKTLQYPYKKSVISDTALFSTLIGIPTITIFLTEVFRWRRHGSKFCFVTVAKYYGVYLFGLASSFMIIGLVKLLVGRLRPNFIARCQPDFFSINCSQGYITEYMCTNTDLSSYDLKNLKMSFPSGHASSTTFCAIYLILYLQDRLHIRISHLLKPILQMVLLTYAIFCSATRISDYKHHPSDVIGGCVFGIVIAILSYVKMAVSSPVEVSDTLPASHTDVTTSSAYVSEPQCKPTDVPFHMRTESHLSLDNLESGCL